MSLIKYELLVAAVEHGSISAAAEIKGYSQSGVSHMINSLEDELGVIILSRGKHGVQLTTVGEDLYPIIRRVVNANNYFNQEVSDILGLIKGKLVIGSFATVSSCYLPTILADFSEKYPQIRFELRNGTYEEIERWIINGEVDCGFVSSFTKVKSNFIPIIRDKFVVITQKGLELESVVDGAVSISSLRNQEIILICSSDYNMLELISNGSGSLDYKMITSDGYAAIEMVKKGLGIGIMSELIAFSFSSEIDIYDLDETYDRSLGLSFLDKRNASPVTKKFIDYLQCKCLKEQAGKGKKEMAKIKNV